MLTTFLLGVILGGTYALAALGLTLQYGIARVMNLAYGEVVVAACFLAFVLLSSAGIGPVLGLVIIAPAGFAVSWLLYGIVFRPLVRRADGHRARLEVDTILVSFGLLFLIQGILLIAFGGNLFSYSFLNVPVNVFGVAIAANRLLAFALAVVIGGTLYIGLSYTRWGTAMRAVANRPEFAALVGIDVDRAARLAFAVGGALAATAGVVTSMYQTFSATGGVVFTMKALIVVIMGGVGNLAGALTAGLFLGFVETFVSAYIDPGLTIAAVYAIFLAVLLWRPSGLFGKPA